MSEPLVSIVCLCYNQSRFVRETIQSVLDQTYKNIELIVVDDASADDSVNIIADYIRDFPQIKFLPLRQNVGNCRAFNQGFKLTRGKYVFDLASDDVLTADRIEKQVAFFEKLPSTVGVVFTDAEYIDENGNFLRTHYDYLFGKKLLSKIPTGDVYIDVIQKYFICTPTMLSRREVFEVLNGYDESLAYEDFDFCVRASRLYQFEFLNEKLTRVRKVDNSMSAKQYSKNDRQLESTYRICKKIQGMNRTVEEKNALINRVRYELRQAVLSENNKEARLFYNLLRELGGEKFSDQMWDALNSLRLPLAGLRRLYHRLRY